MGIQEITLVAGGEALVLQRSGGGQGAFGLAQHDRNHRARRLGQVQRPGEAPPRRAEGLALEPLRHLTQGTCAIANYPLFSPMFSEIYLSPQHDERG